MFKPLGTTLAKAQGTKMKITKRQLRRIIREEKAKLSQRKLNETHSMDSVQELDNIRINISDIAVGVYQNDPELANDLEMQVERLEILHDKLRRSLQGGTMMEKDEVSMLKVGDLNKDKDKDKEAKGMYGQSMRKKKKK